MMRPEADGAGEVKCQTLRGWFKYDVLIALMMGLPAR